MHSRWKRPDVVSAIALLLVALLLLLRGLATHATPVSSLWPDRDARHRVGVMLAALLGYVLETMGYLMATAGLLLVLLRRVGRQGWAATLIVAIASAGGSCVLFARWLMVSLPAGLRAP